MIASVAVLLVAGGAGGAYYVLHTRGTPQETAQRFLQSWSRGDLAAMRAELTAPAARFDATYRELTTALRVQRTSVTLAGVRETGDDRAVADYTATLTLRDLGEWRYRGTLELAVADRHWKVAWTPQAVHPALDGTTRLALKTTWPERAAIVDRNGERVDDGRHGGSVQQLVGYLDKATAKDVQKLGPVYKPGDAIGRGGLQETFQERLAGTPTAEIQVLRADEKKPVRVLETFEGEKGEPVEVTLDLAVQRAAAEAVLTVEKPASLVAVRPSTGEILAVVNNKGGFNRALDGRYPPGSTFKAVTAAGLLAAGVSADETVTCPKYATVGGLRVRNSEHAEYGSLPFIDAFAHSCNTTFAPLTVQRLDAAGLQDIAGRFGFNQTLNIGVPAAKASMPKATSDAELAAESFGQGRITASPLVMATVAAAIADGTWRPPTLVASLEQQARPRELPAGVAEPLRRMMRAVVTRGTAASAGLPAGTAGKTGTAEYGTGPELDSHAWFIGYTPDDLAFAVVVEGGGGGGKVAAPLAARFLRNLG